MKKNNEKPPALRRRRVMRSNRKQMNFRPPEGTYEKFLEIHESLHKDNKSQSFNETLGVIVDKYYAIVS